jgi:RsiW-degrading membrane proteinase PrsW (M82 family)
METPPPPPQPNDQPHCIIPIHKPSRKELIFFFSSGILVSIPFALFFSNFYRFLPQALAIIIIAPFIEELAKVFPLFYRHGETERSYVVLGLLIGLGFGISEFVLYVGLLGAPIVVRIPGIIFHASSASITAYGISKKNPLPYYLTAVALHVGNNFFASTANIFSGTAELLILIVVYLLAWRYYRKSSKDKMVV